MYGYQYQYYLRKRWNYPPHLLFQADDSKSQIAFNCLFGNFNPNSKYAKNNLKERCKRKERKEEEEENHVKLRRCIR